MAEPSAPTAPAAASARDVLLATKLHLPIARRGAVPRSRLIERLETGVERGLVLVCAPAGYGKTALLAQWIQHSGYPAAWLSLDASDNDPIRFWRHAVAALDRIRAGTAEQVRPLLGGSAPVALDGLVTALINALAAVPEADDALLVLDDYHLIESSHVHASIAFLLDHLPHALHVTLASRSDPPLPLARMRARGELTELRAADLRFTPDEAAALLHEALGPGRTLTETTVSALVTRTEGWAAGLQLAALSLRGQTDVAGFVAAFTGSHRHVLDYLTEEVLERETEQTRTFLLETSVLERLNADLCDTITGRPGSQAILEYLDRSNLFLIPLDEVRGWWRYHHLFADLLRARLQHQPDRTHELHRVAAAWYEQRGLPDDAIHHTLAAGDEVWAARLIETHFDTVFNLRGEEATIRRWLPALSDEVVRSRPRLLLAQAQMAAMRGDLETMEPLTDAAERVSAGATEESFVPTAGIAGSLLINVPAVIVLQRSYAAQLRGDADATETYALQALARVADGELMLSAAIQGFLVVVEWLRGHLEAAERGFASSIAGWHPEEQTTTTAWGYYSLARIQRARGCLDAAVQTCRSALEVMAAPGRQALPAAGPALVGLAEVAYQRNDLGAAFEYVGEGITLCREFVHSPPLAAGLMTLAWLRHATGDPQGARAAAAEAEQYALGPAGLFNPVPERRARLALAQGDLDEAARWARSSGLTADDDPHYPREAGHLLLARVLLAQGRAEHAVALLDRLHAAAVAQNRIGSVIEAAALRSLGHAACGLESDAVVELAETLRLAYPQRHVRVFADEGDAMAVLLSRVITDRRAGRPAARVPLAYIARIQLACRAAPTGVPEATHQRIIDALTAREAQVLGMLASGRSNQAIAAELVVTLDTVKKHVSHVLDKLGASNRTEAVARARELGLIP